MTREQYHALVERVEEYARRHPEAYKIRLGLLALFGYAYIWLMLAVIAAVLALLVLLAETLSGGVVMALLKLGWPLLVLAYGILRALWVRFPRPEGIEIVRRDAPELFRAVDDLRRTLACPRFHHVLLTDEWNAGVVQRPRLGPFGWYENYLELGVPLMAVPRRLGARIRTPVAEPWPFRLLDLSDPRHLEPPTGEPRPGRSPVAWCLRSVSQSVRALLQRIFLRAGTDSRA